MRFMLRLASALLLVTAACAARPVADRPPVDKYQGAELEKRLDWIAENTFYGMIGAVPQRGPDPLEGGRPAGLQEVSIPTKDGLALRAWFIPPERLPARATVLVLPGAGSYLEFALGQSRFLLAEGYQLLLVEQRSLLFRGRAGEFRGFLEEDLRDVGTALAWLRARKDVDPSRLAVYGFSWGGTKALLAGKRYPELRAVIDDAGPTVPWVFMRTFMDYAPPRVRADEAVRRSYLARLEALMRRELGYGLDAVDVERAAAALAPRPLLVIHSEEDSMCAIVNSERVFAAAGEPKQFLRRNDLGHCLGMKRNPGVYIPAVSGFLGKIFPEPARP